MSHVTCLKRTLPVTIKPILMQHFTWNLNELVIVSLKLTLYKCVYRRMELSLELDITDSFSFDYEGETKGGWLQENSMRDNIGDDNLMWTKNCEEVNII